MTKNSKGDSQPVVPAFWRYRLPPRTVLSALATLALCELGFYVFAVRPAARGEEERRERVAQLAEQVGEARLRVASIRAAAARLEETGSEGHALVQRIALARRSAFSALLTELGAAAAQAGVEIRETSYAVEPIEGSEEFGILAVNANFRGRYDELVQLLYRLDRSDLFFIIGSLGATPRDAENSDELQINMRFDTFVRDL